MASTYLLEQGDRIRLHAGHVEAFPVRLEGDAREVRAVVLVIYHRLILRKNKRKRDVIVVSCEDNDNKRQQ